MPALRTSYHFVKGDLPGGYAHNDADANALQKLIWKIEEAFSYSPTGKYADWYNAALAHEAAGGGLLSVKVLNLKTAAGLNAQDVLHFVPEPGTLLLLGTGLIAAFSLLSAAQLVAHSPSRKRRPPWPAIAAIAPISFAL